MTNCRYCGKPIFKLGEEQVEREFIKYVHQEDGTMAPLPRRSMVTVERWVHSSTGEHLCDETKKTGAYPKKE